MLEAKSERAAGSRILVLGLLLAALISLMLAAKPAHAKDFTVTTTSDSGAGSLRKAITAANDTPGADTIEFDIPGTGVKTISPASELPTITDQVTIDGYSQPGAESNSRATGGTNANLLVELNGDNRVSDGLRISASKVVVRGLVINRFSGEGIEIANTKAKGNRIEGNFIGTDPSGEQFGLNNDGSGVSIAGTKGRNTVGGASPEARNLISANDGSGVSINFDKGGNQVQGNLIGTDKDGTDPRNNSGAGVGIRDSSNNTVGGTKPEAANTMAFNIGGGVEILGDSAGNRILGNSTFANGFFDGFGSIDLGGDGPSNNDPRDIDKGPNNLQNFPVVTSADKFSGGTTVIEGTLDSTPSTKKKKTFTIQLFANPQVENERRNEGKTFLGQVKVTTDREGKASFSFETTRPLRVGENITATATDKGGNTSEFSDPETVSIAPGQG